MTEPTPDEKPLLLCLDLEPDSEALCRAALARARRCGQPVQVLHVMPAFSEPRPVEGRLHALLGRCGAEVARVMVESGSPEERIPQVAARCGADPVVLGRRSRTTVDRIYVGSTTSAVISLCRTPVLVIPLPGEG